MAVNFNSNSVFNLKPINVEEVRKEATMPYSKIQYFSIQTPGFLEMIPDSELYIMFTNGFTAKFEFKGAVDIGKIGRILSEYVL